MKQFILKYIVSVFISQTLWSGASAAPPNILLIMVDDMG